MKSAPPCASTTPRTSVKPMPHPFFPVAAPPLSKRRSTRATSAGVDALRASTPLCRIEYVGQPSIALPHTAAVTETSIAGWVKAMGGMVVEREGRIPETGQAHGSALDVVVEAVSSQPSRPESCGGEPKQPLSWRLVSLEREP